ncbi:carbohydrate binding family 6 [Pochonia chlamydosporia 170]|uniref:Carbohydrate binding family 6 n=1 Tax=Pochonia chlamydosporia 170 TaxID=1380566 RepID=A0A179FTS4_METCM|nr:carbohydrate binding family 6 [Pochonia chlamydosporia 170]OAQ69056.1 carbohydrate binding family 6 [Pochonia chlamydosporia 170]
MLPRYITAVAVAAQIAQCNPLEAHVGVKVKDFPRGFRTCVFYDDFSEGKDSLPDPAKWTIDLGTQYSPNGPAQWGTGEIQTYTDNHENIHITPHQTLKITPRRDKHGNWTSSRIETTAEWDFSCQKGERVRVEARIKLGGNPKNQSLGMWPAFWALGSEYRGNYWNWPAVGEIDILESVNGERKLWNVVHCGTNPGGVCNEPVGIGHVTEPFEKGVWHTLAWEAHRAFGKRQESMSWYLDGRRTWTLWKRDVGDEAAWEAMAGAGKMLLLNVAVGGGFPNGVAGITTPTKDTLDGEGASMEVDYVAVYKKERW